MHKVFSVIFIPTLSKIQSMRENVPELTSLIALDTIAK